ncbi:MAG TPA: lysylphosphatidylglycerol synthase transmembrane domain-containing protein [Mucilaginibacter sp.]|nr:flippase-like domain-containing protein [Bacteroidota bacterium]HVS91909.1 lysylphosphatidylglycerol synthase transmembrane domain-containing protein [Mucilaginibacter sp.]
MAEIEDIVEDNPNPRTWKHKLWNVTKLLLKIGVTSVLLYYVFSKVPFSEVKNRLVHANYWWMLAAIIVYFFSMVASAWRLMSFFKSIELRLDTRFNFRLYLLGIFYNLLLPGGIGGDGYKIYLLHKNYHLPAKKVFWAIAFDRLSGLWAIGLIVVVLTIFIPQIQEMIHLAIPIGVFVVGTVVYYVVVKIFFKDFTKHFFKGHAKAVIVQALQVLTVICFLMGQDFTGKFSPYLLSFLMSALAAVVPITFGGAGAREYIFKVLSPVFHLNVGLAIFLSVSFYLTSLIVALSGLYYVIRPKRLEAGLPSIKQG